MSRRVDLSDLFVTARGKLSRFEYLRFELDEEAFYRKVYEKEDFADDDQVFEIDVNCVGVLDFVENHPLFPLIVWDDKDIMFGFNPRFIDDSLGW